MILKDEITLGGRADNNTKNNDPLLLNLNNNNNNNNTNEYSYNGSIYQQLAGLSGVTRPTNNQQSNKENYVANY